MSDPRVFIRAIKRTVSMTAALDTGSFWVSEPGDPLIIDPERIYVRRVGRRDEPTVFESREEAERIMERLLAQVDAVLRRSGSGVDVGWAAGLLAHPNDPTKRGYLIEDYAGWLAVKEMDEDFRRRRQAEAEAEADERVRAAAAQADAIRAERGTLAPAEASIASEWHAHGEPLIQQRRRKDGSVVYRARRAGATSPSFDTLQAARDWRDRLPDAPPHRGEPDPAIAEKLLADTR
jgi:hypothetical protein